MLLPLTADTRRYLARTCSEASKLVRQTRTDNLVRVSRATLSRLTFAAGGPASPEGRLYRGFDARD